MGLSKAYNTLPRGVLKMINHRLGLGRLWAPYSQFLDGLQRHIVVQNSWGDGVQSCSVVPEGCPYAVVQMVLVTWVFTAAVQQETHIAMHSYVDDWVIADEDHNKVAKTMNVVKELTKNGLILSLEFASAFASSNTGAK